ncbi:putative myb/SANT-like DNA-binding domain containing protein [Lyophyllum shimeji]|uniref:Myb/SANT-like DNA-binding domain containing protein n=1 Tax=Lyophyllum shimeji TaxID=47721 RepID=A0A9P3PXR9_LYOSH|nr:putative myb/SANT-like DNA-binding domain containing protein [Lyophyllum shimeji]
MPKKAPLKPPKKAKWSSADDATLVATLHEEQAKGHQSDTGWKAVTWAACQKALEGSELISGGAPKKAKGCHDHWNLLASQCKQVRRLRGISGWGWDDERHVVVASEQQWESIVENEPQLEKWRENFFPLYDEILPLIDGRFATGENAIHMPEMQDSSPVHDSGPDDTGDAPSASPAIEFSGILGDTYSADEDDGPKSEGDIVGVSQSLTTPARPISKRASHDTLASASIKKRKHTTNTSTVVGEMVNAFREAASSFSSDGLDDASAMHATPARRQRAVQLLTADGELADGEIVRALRLFRQDCSIADTFSAIPKKALRTAYIQEELASM